MRGASTWRGYDAIWYENGAKPRWDIPPALGKGYTSCWLFWLLQRLRRTEEWPKRIKGRDLLLKVIALHDKGYNRQKLNWHTSRFIEFNLFTLTEVDMPNEINGWYA